MGKAKNVWPLDCQPFQLCCRQLWWLASTFYCRLFSLVVLLVDWRPFFTVTTSMPSYLLELKWNAFQTLVTSLMRKFTLSTLYSDSQTTRELLIHLVMNCRKDVSGARHVEQFFSQVVATHVFPLSFSLYKMRKESFPYLSALPSVVQILIHVTYRCQSLCRVRRRICLHLALQNWVQVW